MSKVYIRADDFELKDILDFFIEKNVDTKNIEYLISDQPVLLVGSRGTGKTMLLRVADRRMTDNFKTSRNLPVYLSLTSSQFVKEQELRIWMLQKILLYLNNSLKVQGFAIKSSFIRKISSIENTPIINKLEKYMLEINSKVDKMEDGDIIDGDAATRDVDTFKMFIEELCTELKINKIIILFDEACQTFNPVQQRAFFDLFKDLRSPRIVCKAAVYPGLVSYGNLQKAHDVTNEIRVERDVTSKEYVDTMRSIVQKYFTEYYDKIIKSGDILDCLIYCSSGNPRFLIKTVELSMEKNGVLKKDNTNNTIKDYYRNYLWTEHEKLADRYPGHAPLIKWGHEFVENRIFHDIDEKSPPTLFFGIERLSPVQVKHALKVLEYSGIIQMHSEAIKYRKEIFNRMLLNIGVYLSHKDYSNPIEDYKKIVENLSPHNYSTYSKGSKAYEGIDEIKEISVIDGQANKILETALALNVSELELSQCTKNKLIEYNFNTVKDILEATEEGLRKMRYVGAVRSSNIENEAYNAIIEFISG